MKTSSRRCPATPRLWYYRKGPYRSRSRRPGDHGRKSPILVGIQSVSLIKSRGQRRLVPRAHMDKRLYRVRMKESWRANHTPHKQAEVDTYLSEGSHPGGGPHLMRGHYTQPYLAIQWVLIATAVLWTEQTSSLPPGTIPQGPGTSVTALRCGTQRKRPLQPPRRPVPFPGIAWARSRPQPAQPRRPQHRDGPNQTQTGDTDTDPFSFMTEKKKIDRPRSSATSANTTARDAPVIREAIPAALLYIEVRSRSSPALLPSRGQGDKIRQEAPPDLLEPEGLDTPLRSKSTACNQIAHRSEAPLIASITGIENAR